MSEAAKRSCCFVPILVLDSDPIERQPIMEDEREISRLWRVNRTIHELVKDRVSRRRVGPGI